MSTSFSDAVLTLAGVTAGTPQISPVTTITQSLRSNNASHLLGNTALEALEVTQWLTFALIAFETKNSELSSINASLLLRSFFVGDSMSIADIAMYFYVSSTIDDSSLIAFHNIKRWFINIQTKLCVKKAIISRGNPTIFFNGTNSDVSDSSTPGPKHDVNKESPIVENATVEANKKEGKDVKSNGDATKVVEKKKEKKVVDAGGNGNIPPTPLELNPMKLDIKVGVILKCWNHPDSDKLLCEEIDVGEEVPRNIASGIRAHYSAEEMVGKRVVVLANLKERAIAGFKSQGMVLCSCTPDHSQIKLVTPPTSAKPGDRITFPGFDGLPATPNEMAKKKILENLSPFLRTNENGVALWKDSAFTVAGAECNGELMNVPVS
jgi:aminoacyl tRNA synthase complex-interacting multifunctional protein 1